MPSICTCCVPLLASHLAQRLRATRREVLRAILRQANMSASSVRGAGVGARFEVVQSLRLVGRDEADLDEVERAHEAVADPEPARAAYRVAQRNRPAVLEQQDRGGGVVRDLAEHVPLAAVSEDLHTALGRDLRTRQSARLEAVLAIDPESDQGSCRAAHLDRLVARQIAEMLD